LVRGSFHLPVYSDSHIRNEDYTSYKQKVKVYFGLEKGYMLSFNFNKDKEQGVKEINIHGKKLIEATV